MFGGWNLGVLDFVLWVLFLVFGFWSFGLKISSLGFQVYCFGIRFGV